MEPPWRRPGGALEAPWQRPGGALQAPWRRPRGALEARWRRPGGALEASYSWRPPASVLVRPWWTGAAETRMQRHAHTVTHTHTERPRSLCNWRMRMDCSDLISFDPKAPSASESVSGSASQATPTNARRVARGERGCCLQFSVPTPSDCVRVCVARVCHAWSPCVLRAWLACACAPSSLLVCLCNSLHRRNAYEHVATCRASYERSLAHS